VTRQWPCISPASPTPVEEIPAGERDAIRTMIATLRRQLTDRYVLKHETVRRDAHPKILGLVEAQFEVSPDCPAELRHGVFRRPGQRFDAQIRFSNGAPVMQHDLAPDVRGMAIKLPGVAGEFLPDGGHDFVLATAEAFFGSNAVDYADFPEASESMLNVLWYFAGGLRLRGGLQLLRSLKTPASPLALEYFSQTPYRFGPHCVKYQARPIAARSCSGDPWYMQPVVRQALAPLAKYPRLMPGAIPADAVRNALIRDLTTGPVRMEFLVQRWPDLDSMPGWAIENATRTWPAPWARIATIEIAQQCSIPARDDRAERMRFSPWHALKVHQPLGSINRARLAVYLAMSAFRNSHNPLGRPVDAAAQVAPLSPEPHEPDSPYVAQ
jgi:Catalase